MEAQPDSLDDAGYSDDAYEADPTGLANNAVDDDNFADEGLEIRPRGFTGQASDVQWMQRLTTELDHEGGGRYQSPQQFSSSTRPNVFAEDMETSIVGDHVDPLELPVKQTADGLVSGYFDSVHASFPVLDRTTFMHQYNLLANIWHMPEAFEDRMFMTTLQLVCAIGAVHAHFSGTGGVSDDRDHYLYFTRARMLGVEHGIFNDLVQLSQAQVFGLGAMYLLITDQMNRYVDSISLYLVFC